ncbi:hypothetical protein KI688_002938 [Linnemannia hyalina]|uniref:Uncharacterized protein n=1 Tax=Linnemannia hyalina TaxID=64524 RepID=A0A9P7XNR5_9FUNG|nr:hypothetical protein KI688_002938 [Linnemannia hyalina]
MTRSIPSLASAAAIPLFLSTTAMFHPHVDVCGVTIHNEVAFKASRILLSTMINLPTLTSALLVSLSLLFWYFFSNLQAQVHVYPHEVKRSKGQDLD